MLRSVTIPYGHFLFKHRNWLFTLVVVVLLFGFEPSIGPIGPVSGRIIDLFGIAVVLAGAAIRIAVVGLAYIKRGGINKKIAADTLVTEGLFDHCRNPLYVGNLLILTGYFIVHGNPVSMLLAALFFGYSYYAITMAEEDFLRRKFGAAYEAYCARVGRWSIRLGGLGQTFGSMTFNWRRVVAKEYTTIYTWNITLLAILAYEYWLQDRLTDVAPILVVYFIALQIGAIVVKYMKRAHVLEPAPAA